MPEILVENNSKKSIRAGAMELISRYIKYLPWLILSTIILLIVAYIILRYSPPVYNVTGKLLVQRANQNAPAERFDDIFMTAGNRNLNDEMEIFKSRAMASRVVKALNLHLQIINQGKIRSTPIHSNQYPFLLIPEKQADSIRPLSCLVTVIDDNQFRVNEEQKSYYFGQPFPIGEEKYRLQKTTSGWQNYASNVFLISVQKTEDVAAGLSGAIQIGQSNEYSNILNISFETENPRIGLDVVNQYMKEYQAASLEDKKLIAGNTLMFIEDQLDTVMIELGGVERNLQNYREQNRLFNPQQQNSVFFNQQSEVEAELTTQSVKIRVIDYLINYILEKENPFRQVPSSLGIEEPSLQQQIQDYNRLQLERETALRTTPAGNPLILNLETGINKLRQDMLENLRNVRNTYQVIINNLRERSSLAESKIGAMPRKEKQLLEVTRQQGILQELYSYLLQKKLETAIASASTISNIRVVEPASSSYLPVKPNRKGTYALALFIGILIPGAIIALKEFFNDKVLSKADVQRATNTPIIGEVGHSKESGTLIVTTNNRRFIGEQFRIIRSNLQYVIPKVDKPVIMVTSTFSGEGKSFVSTNLGAVMALSGKKTVILEFDIRKPKIMKGLGLRESKGITNYIVGNLEISDIVYQVPEVENLYVIPCGPVPPNPAEMLLDEKVAELFKALRQEFDQIIVDSAPVGLVSDTLTLAKHSDATIFIVRHQYTLKAQLELVDQLYNEKKLPALSIIINDIKVNTGYGSNYGYGNYGYGRYGYGASSDYFDKEKSNKNSLKDLFGKPGKQKD